MTAPPSARTLSKSDYTLARSCDAKLYFRENRYKDDRGYDPYLQLLADGGYMVDALARTRYPDGILLEYGRDPAEDFANTLEHLERDRVTLFQATLLWGRRLARVDILDKTGDEIRLIEVKAKSFDGAAHAAAIAAGSSGVFRQKSGALYATWQSKFEDLAFQSAILKSVLPTAHVAPYLMLVDKGKRSCVDNLPRLFALERHVARDGTTRLHSARFIGSAEDAAKLDLLTEVGARAEVALVKDLVEEEAQRFEPMLDAEMTTPSPLGAQCSDCEFHVDGDATVSGFKRCWGNLADVAPHALELFSIGTVVTEDGAPMIDSLARAGTVSLFDIPKERLVKKDGKVGANNVRQLRQIDQTRSGSAWVGPELGRKLAQLEYPLHFIDFETSRLALPYHARMRPYGLVAFQWSCHTVQSPGAAPAHTEWLNADDAWPNKNFSRTLRDAIGDSARVLTWSAFEASTLREIVGEHEQFDAFDPALVSWVGDLIGPRMFDLHKCARDDFYHPGMKGKTSIKNVLDALWTTDGAMREQFTAWTGMPAPEGHDPYHALPALEINGVRQELREGTGAIRAYEAMMYGVERADEGAKRKWRELLLQYCKLDTLSMVLVFEHWRRVTGA